jgi:hypothetical protein
MNPRAPNSCPTSAAQLAIAVGIPLTLYPPAQTRTGAHERIRFLSQMSGGEASVRKRMERSRFRKPALSPHEDACP